MSVFVRLLFPVVAASLLLPMCPCAASGVVLHEAVRRNDIPEVETWIQRSGTQSVHAVIGGGVTPLHIAAAMNHVIMANLLLSHGANPEARTAGGFTPLHWAASRNASDTTRLLIDTGVDLNTPASNGITALHWAADRGATNTVELLVRAGARVDPATASGLTPLHWALRHGDDDIATLLAYKTVADDMEEELIDLILHVAGDQAASCLKPPAFPIPLPPPEYRGKPLTIDLGQGQELTCVWIPAMGLWAGKYEVTNGQFRRFKPSHDSMFFETFDLDGTNQPAVYVSWQDAVDFCDWVNRIAADRLPPAAACRLPSCYEWVTLARCGTTRDFSWGESWPPTQGNFADTALGRVYPDTQIIEGYTDGWPVTCDVRHSGTNEWGLFGMSGNVWEWCRDSVHAESEYKLRCGGSWDFDTEPTLHLDTPGFDRASARYDTIGFRVVIAVKSVPIADLRPDTPPQK